MKLGLVTSGCISIPGLVAFFGKPRVLVIAGMVAIASSMPIHAGTLYKCIGDDGVAAYVSERIKGASCSVVSHFVSGTSNRSVVRDPQVVSPNVTQDAPLGINQGYGPGGSGDANTTLHTESHARLPDPVLFGNVEDFGDSNGAFVLAKVRAPKGDFRYVQIGDSHTAGDFLTDQLRVRLQSRLGDGGVGWAMPMRVPGQRLARANYDVDGWKLISSRKDGPADYPFGGFMAQVASDHAVLTIKSKQGEPQQTITAVIRQGPHDAPLEVTGADGHQQFVQSPVADGVWRNVSFTAQLPVIVLAEHSPETAIGGWWFRAPQQGAIVSAVGINGSVQSQWSRWRTDWMQDLEPGQPDLIAIAYGTNEAFSETMDATSVRTGLESAVDQLRQHFPHAAILILGAPESLSAQGGRCGVRAPGLDVMQSIQKQVAIGRKTLFWDWQQAMGGTCSMKRWIEGGLGRGDGVHFTAAGYVRLGDDLYEGLEGLAQRLTDSISSGQTQHTTSSLPQGRGRALMNGRSARLAGETALNSSR
jgi:lysophospholipase L1-like esterase